VLELLAGRAWGLRDADDCEGKEPPRGDAGEVLTAAADEALYQEREFTRVIYIYLSSHT